jgi:hypothetical protein
MQLSPFALEINNGTAIFRFNHPLHSFDDAERRLGEFLSSWEGEMLLQTGPRRREFSVKEIGRLAMAFAGPIQISMAQ